MRLDAQDATVDSLTTSDEKILVIGPAWVGDMVMAQSLLIDLKQRLGNVQIDMLAPAWTAALIDRMPQVTSLIEGDLPHKKLALAERRRLAMRVKQGGYSQAILLPNSLKSAFVPWLAKVPKRSGFIGEQRWGLVNDIRRLNKQALPMTVQRFIALGEHKGAEPRALSTIPVPKLEVDQQQVTEICSRNNLGKGQSVLALCPGAEFGASKQWPEQHYAALAKFYLQQGWQVWLMGSQKDVVSCQNINQQLDDQAHVLAGKTTLPDAIDLLSVASLVVSNDSGLMHIAAALHRPVVAVYGSTDPGHTPPLSDNSRVVRLGLECSPCFKRECPLGHLNCLHDLLPEQVIAQAESLLNKRPEALV